MEKRSLGVTLAIQFLIIFAKGREFVI